MPKAYHMSITYCLKIIFLPTLFFICGNAFCQSEDLAKERYEQGKLAFEKKNWSEAISRLTSALSLTQNKAINANCLYFRGISFYRLDSCKKMTEDFAQLRLLLPSGPPEKQAAVINDLLADCKGKQVSANQTFRRIIEDVDWAVEFVESGDGQFTIISTSQTQTSKKAVTSQLELIRVDSNGNGLSRVFVLGSKKEGLYSSDDLKAASGPAKGIIYWQAVEDKYRSKKKGTFWFWTITSVDSLGRYLWERVVDSTGYLPRVSEIVRTKSDDWIALASLDKDYVLWHIDTLGNAVELLRRPQSERQLLSPKSAKDGTVVVLEQNQEGTMFLSVVRSSEVLSSDIGKGSSPLVTESADGGYIVVAKDISFDDQLRVIRTDSQGRKLSEAIVRLPVAPLSLLGLREISGGLFVVLSEVKSDNATVATLIGLDSLCNLHFFESYGSQNTNRWAQQTSSEGTLMVNVQSFDALDIFTSGSGITFAARSLTQFGHYEVTIIKTNLKGKLK